MIQYLVICQHDSPRKGALYTPEQELKTDRRDVVEYMEALRKEDMRPVFVASLPSSPDPKIFVTRIELEDADEFEAEYWADVEAEKTGPYGDVPAEAGDGRVR